MMHQSDMRDLLNRVMVVNHVYCLADIYNLVERYGNLDSADLSLSGKGTNDDPRWKQTVRKTLHNAQKKSQALNTSPKYHKRLKQFQ